jgi:hypothetical protein
MDSFSPIPSKSSVQDNWEKSKGLEKPNYIPQGLSYSCKDLSRREGKKRVPRNLVKEHLTDRSLAYWLMDDGGKSNYNKDRPKLNGVTINTQGFSKAEVDHLVAQLISVFGLDCWIGRDKGKWTIVISGKLFPTLAKRIGTYIHHSMVYKFPKGLQEFL